MDQLNAKLEQEKLDMDQRLKAYEAELEQAKQNQSDAARIAELEEQVKIERAKNVKYQQEKLKKLIAEGIRQKQLMAEYNRVEKRLNSIIPMVNEANLAANELGRQIKFSSKLIKKMDPFLKAGALSQGPTDVIIKVENNEDKYFYEWTIDMFKDRIILIREILDDYFETGKKPTLAKS